MAVVTVAGRTPVYELTAADLVVSSPSDRQAACGSGVEILTLCCIGGSAACEPSNSDGLLLHRMLCDVASTSFAVPQTNWRSSASLCALQVRSLDELSFINLKQLFREEERVAFQVCILLHLSSCDTCRSTLACRPRHAAAGLAPLSVRWLTCNSAVSATASSLGWMRARAALPTAMALRSRPTMFAH